MGNTQSIESETEDLNLSFIKEHPWPYDGGRIPLDMTDEQLDNEFFSAKVGEYYILDNGSKPYKVVVYSAFGHPSRIWVVCIHKRNTNGSYDEKPFYSTNAKKVFIGKSPMTETTLNSGGYGPEFDGNTILVKIANSSESNYSNNVNLPSKNKHEYLYIGPTIKSFFTDHEIVTYVSEVGNSSVAYPYAIDDFKNVYLMETGTMFKSNSPILRSMKPSQFPDYYGEMYKLELKPIVEAGKPRYEKETDTIYQTREYVEKNGKLYPGPIDVEVHPAMKNIVGFSRRKTNSQDTDPEYLKLTIDSTSEKYGKDWDYFVDVFVELKQEIKQVKVAKETLEKWIDREYLHPLGIAKMEWRKGSRQFSIGFDGGFTYRVYVEFPNSETNVYDPVVIDRIFSDPTIEKTVSIFHLDQKRVHEIDQLSDEEYEKVWKYKLNLPKLVLCKTLNTSKILVGRDDNKKYGPIDSGSYLLVKCKNEYMVIHNLVETFELVKGASEISEFHADMSSAKDDQGNYYILQTLTTILGNSPARKTFPIKENIVSYYFDFKTISPLNKVYSFEHDVYYDPDSDQLMERAVFYKVYEGKVVEQRPVQPRFKNIIDFEMISDEQEESDFGQRAKKTRKISDTQYKMSTWNNQTKTIETQIISGQEYKDLQAEYEKYMGFVPLETQIVQECDFHSNLDASTLKPKSSSRKSTKSEIAEYARLPNKIVFEPLSLDIVKRNIGKPIKYYVSNGDDPRGKYGPALINNIQDRNNREKVFFEMVIFPGDTQSVSTRPNRSDLYSEDTIIREDENYKYGQMEAETYIYDEIIQEYEPNGEYEFVIMPFKGKGDEFEGILVLSNSNNGYVWVERGKY